MLEGHWHHGPALTSNVITSVRGDIYVSHFLFCFVRAVLLLSMAVIMIMVAILMMIDINACDHNCNNTF